MNTTHTTLYLAARSDGQATLGANFPTLERALDGAVSSRYIFVYGISTYELTRQLDHNGSRYSHAFVDSSGISLYDLFRDTFKGRLAKASKCLDFLSKTYAAEEQISEATIEDIPYLPLEALHDYIIGEYAATRRTEGNHADIMAEFLSALNNIPFGDAVIFRSSAKHFSMLHYLLTYRWKTYDRNIPLVIFVDSADPLSGVRYQIERDYIDIEQFKLFVEQSLSIP